ncbi:MAG TPA: selenium cofactor biosynthesis protein YqeC, partial [Bacillota bacterium]|nr:selenium cofactor biosynthesis protein YqeC [Bacillota bacterium]
MNLFEAFGLNKGDIIAVTGGGGKTSLMYALGREAQALGLRPVLTTTTKILPPTDAGYALLVENEPEALTLLIQEELSSGSQLVIGSGIAGDGKLLGMDCSVIPLLSAGGVGLVVVEADGSAGRPFKAPGPHEPVVPPASTHVVTVVGIDCLGRPLLPEYIHRPELVERLTGLRLGQPVTPQVVARVLTHP